jgi:hypothetical protein
MTARAPIGLRCAVCSSPDVPLGNDDHPHTGQRVIAPKLFACAGTPHRWFGTIVAVFCSPKCGLAWRQGLQKSA